MKKVLVAVPIKPTLHPELRRRCQGSALYMRDHNPDLELTYLFDHRAVETLPSDSRPWSKVTRARNAILDSIKWENFDYIFWADADVVGYPPNLPSWLIAVNPEGVSAPFILVEDSKTFYDWAAFIIKGRDHIEPENRLEIAGRNLHGEFPYWPEMMKPAVVEMDCVGTVTLVPTEIYKHARYEDHPAFTDHYPICKAARKLGRKVIVDQRVVAYHAYLPNYGEDWH